MAELSRGAYRIYGEAAFEVLAKAQEAFDQSFRAIVKHLVFLKWNQEQPKSE